MKLMNKKNVVMLQAFVVKFQEKVQLQCNENQKSVTIDKLLYQLQIICFCLINLLGIMEA